MEIWKRRGFNNFRIGKAWGLKHFGISEGKLGWGVKCEVEVVHGGVWIFSGIIHLNFCYFIIYRLVFRTVEILWNLLEFGSKQEVS